MCQMQNIIIIFYHTFLDLHVLILYPKSLIMYRNKFLWKFVEFSPVLQNLVNSFRKVFNIVLNQQTNLCILVQFALLTV